MPVSTTGALVSFTDDRTTQHFMVQVVPNKYQDLSKYLVFSLFMSKNACFSYPISGTAHHCQRIND